MKIFGLTITRTKQVPLSPVDLSLGWYPLIREPFSGAWQRNLEIRAQDVLAVSTVFACITLIASDISKLWLRLMEKGDDGIWTEVENNSPFLPVLRKPNHYQNRIKFIQYWMISKLSTGNAYALKQRDSRGIVTALYLLDPQRVKVLVAPNGDVYYQLNTDALSGIPDQDVTVPASEVIHDLMYPLYHPLVGVSPIYACGLAAMQSLKIQQNSERFFANSSQPGGILSAPSHIPPDTAVRLKEYWEANFTGQNVGRVAVLGDGLAYSPMAVTPKDALIVDQLKLSAEGICTAFHVPPYKVGVGPPPNYNNIEALNQGYYSDCLQVLIEETELCLDEGLELPRSPRELGVEFDLDALLRMDTATATKAAADAITAGFLKPNEARAKFNLGNVEGGDTPYLQQQNFSLAALARRDAQGPAPLVPGPSSAAPASDTPTGEPEMDFDALSLIVTKGVSDYVTSDAWM